MYNTFRARPTEHINNRRTNNWDSNVFIDNHSAIKLACNPIITSCSRHIELRYHYIREQVDQGNFKLLPIAGKDNPADLFTKPLGPTLFNKHREQLFPLTHNNT